MTADDPDADWRDEMMAEALEEATMVAGMGKGTIVAGGHVVDRFSDPALAFRVYEAEQGDRVAREGLCRIYRDAHKAKRLGELPLVVLIYIHEIKEANGGSLPPATGGRPRAVHRAFALAVAVEVERRRGLTLCSALDRVADHAPRDTVEQAHKDWRGTTEMCVELEQRRKSAADAGLSQIAPVNLKALAELEPPRKSKPPRGKPK